MYKACFSFALQTEWFRQRSMKKVSLSFIHFSSICRIADQENFAKMIKNWNLKHFFLEMNCFRIQSDSFLNAWCYQLNISLFRLSVISNFAFWQTPCRINFVMEAECIFWHWQERWERVGCKFVHVILCQSCFCLPSGEAQIDAADCQSVLPLPQYSPKRV